jgi:2,5-diketo-D-gluconate reductase B
VGAQAIATNQVEISPYLQNRALAAFLAPGRHAPDVLHDPGLRQGAGRPGAGRIAAAHGATTAQVALAWALQHGVFGDPVFDQAREPAKQP